MGCRGCGSKRGQKEIESQIYQCGKCGAIYGTTYLGDSYKYVLPNMTSRVVFPEDLRYYDFTCLSSKGIIRRHGWYDVTSKLIVQVG